MELVFLFAVLISTPGCGVLASLLNNAKVTVSEAAVVQRTEEVHNFIGALSKCNKTGWDLARYYDEDTKWAVHRNIKKVGKKSRKYWIDLVLQKRDASTSVWAHWDRTQRVSGDWVTDPTPDSTHAYTDGAVSPKLRPTTETTGVKYTICSKRVPQAVPELKVEGKCVEKLIVEWEESDKEVYPDLPFRILVTDLDSISSERSLAFTYGPNDIEKSEGKYRTVLEGLKTYRNYMVQVMRCMTPCCCSPNVSSATILYEGGPAEVMNANMNLFPQEGECEVTWAFGKNHPIEEIQGFKVTIEASETTEFFLNNSALKDNFVERRIVDIDVVERYRFKTSPNRNYRVRMETKGCDRLSKTVKVGGACITEPTLPIFLPPPGLMLKNGKRVLRASLPSELTGKVSCLFVILKPSMERPFTVPTTMYSVEQLRMASQNITELDKETVVAALPRKSFFRTFLDVNLEEESQSTCNILQDGDPNNDYSVENTGLNSKWFYSMFIVSSMRHQRGPMLQKSTSTILLAMDSTLPPGEYPTNSDGSLVGSESENACNSTTFSILAALFGLILIGEVGVAFDLWRRQSEESNDVEKDGKSGGKRGKDGKKAKKKKDKNDKEDGKKEKKRKEDSKKEDKSEKKKKKKKEEK